MEEEKVKKNTLWKSILKAIKKRLKPGHLLFLAILLGTNAFAWYIYMDRINSDINVRVKSWNVSFTLDNQVMTDYINFAIDEMYPGMTPYQESLSVTNDGEMAANLTYEVISFKVFDTLLILLFEGVFGLILERPNAINAITTTATRTYIQLFDFSPSLLSIEFEIKSFSSLFFSFCFK